MNSKQSNEKKWKLEIDNLVFIFYYAYEIQDRKFLLILRLFRGKRGLSYIEPICVRYLVKSNFTRSLAVFKKIPNKTIFFLMMSYKFSDLDNLIDVLMVYELVFHIHDLCGLHGHFT